MKILSIGNSFSVDCQRYVREIALAGGCDITLGNLYIGGCSLERHCENMKSGKPEYEYFRNNKSLGACALETALKEDNWDIITLQQASHFSGQPETYYPFINELSDYVRSICPCATQAVNETWAYEYNSTHHAFPQYNSDRVEMHNRLRECYNDAAKAIGAMIIPVGNAVALAREDAAFNPENGGIALTRDGFHLSYKLGRYLAGCVWCAALTNINIPENTFVPADYEFIGRNNVNGEPMYRVIEASEAHAEDLLKLKKYCLSACRGLKR